jgi:hypothetical protein
MIFAPTVIKNTLPQVSVTVADSGNPPITYNEIKQSLGSQVYNIDMFYLFSTVQNQLIGVIKYNRYDVNGNADVRNIVTTIDPYQYTNALYKDLTKQDFGFILNGNSSVSSIILPQAFIEFRLFTRRITNAMGINQYNFSQMEDIFKKHYYGTFNGFEFDGDTINFEDLPPKTQADFMEMVNMTQEITIENMPKQNHEEGLAVLSIAAIGVGLYLFYGK